MPNNTLTQNAAARSIDMPIAGMSMGLRAFAENTRAADAAGQDKGASFELVFTTGAPVKRYDWANDRYYMEQLDVSSAAIDLSRLERGAPLLNTHSAYRLEDQIGVVDQPAIDGGAGTVQALLSRRDSVAGIVQDIKDGVIRNVSVGYTRDAMEMIAPMGANAMWTYKVTRWTPMEVSLVPIPADMDSQVRSEGGTLKDTTGRELRAYPCLITQASPAQTPAAGDTAELRGASRITPQGMTMPRESISPAGGADAADQTAAATAQRTAADAAIAAAYARSADITDLCARHGASELASGLVRNGSTVDQARAAVLDHIAVRDAAAGGQRNVTQIRTVTDAMDVRMAGLEQAIMHRVSAATKLDDHGKQYRGMSLLEMGREFLEAHGQNVRGLDKLGLATRMLHFRAPGMMGSGDFSSLFANVANKRLRDVYSENAGTYKMWARRAPNAPDFKNISVVQLSAMPDLLKVNESGEFTYGSLSDGAESYAVLTYGRIVTLTRQAVINDDLRGFDRMVSGFGSAAARLENRTVYSQLTGNGLMSDGLALFEAGTHKNLATGGGSALAEASLKAARTAMRLQKGLQGEELNIAPAYLLVPAALEQDAYKLTSSQFVPAKQSDVNEFRVGGRTAVEPIIEPILDANSATRWYALAQNSQVDTVEYCYLDGAEGPVIESEMGFETDGVSYKCRLDFASKAIDHRGMYRADGV